MKVTIRKALFAVALMIGVATMPHKQADAQAVLSTQIQAAITAAMTAPGGADLAALNALMTANAVVAGLIASTAGQLQPALAAAIGAQVAAVLKAAPIPAETKGQQIAAAGQGLAAANPDAAVTIFSSMANAAPELAGDAAAGVTQGAPQ